MDFREELLGGFIATLLEPVGSPGVLQRQIGSALGWAALFGGGGYILGQMLGFLPGPVASLCVAGGYPLAVALGVVLLPRGHRLMATGFLPWHALVAAIFGMVLSIAGLALSIADDWQVRGASPTLANIFMLTLLVDVVLAAWAVFERGFRLMTRES